jgi:hypothetical protein
MRSNRSVLSFRRIELAFRRGYLAIREQMMDRRGLRILSALAGLLAVSSQAFAGTVIITQQEASLPPDEIVAGRRGITRGPHVDLVQPAEQAYSPLRFQIRFRAFGGARINTDSLRVVYLKTPEIDITTRVIRFVQPDGIDIPDAEAPAGEHYIRIEVKDSEGRIGGSVFALKIIP